MALAEVFAAVREVCLGGRPIEEAFALAPVERERMEVYRRFVAGHLVNILHHVYPRTERELGDERFARLREAFYAEHPPASWDQNRNAEPFPSFLRERAAGDDALPPHVVELADYEWCDFAVAVSTEIIPLPERVAAPALNPTLVLRPLHFDIAGWVRAEGPGSGSAPPRDEQILAFYRHPHEDRTYVRRATPLLLVVLKMLFEGVPLDRVLAETGLAVEALELELASLARDGLVVRPPSSRLTSESNRRDK